MPDQTFEITAPNGKVLSVTGDHVPTEAELQQIFKSAGVETGAEPPARAIPSEMPRILDAYGVKPGAGLTIPEGIHKGRTFALGDDGKTITEIQPGNAANRADSNVIQAQTRFGSVGLAPEDLLLGASIGKRAVDAVRSGAARGVTSGVIQGIKSLATSTAPIIKYEIAKHALETAGVPPSIAAITAVAISGYSKKGATAATAAAESPHVPTAEGYERFPSAPASASVEKSFRKDISSPAAEAPAAAAVESRAATPIPQKTLNELAIQARRQGVKLSEADYQTASEAVAQGKTAAEAVRDVHPSIPEPMKLKFTAPEFQQYGQLRKIGKTHREAMEAIDAMRTLQDRLLLRTPSVADTKFPKGMRGKVVGS